MMLTHEILSTVDAGCGPTASPALEVRNVSKWFTRGSSKTIVLDAVDLEVRRGECVFLIGPSGSGKTTLLSIMGCVLTPNSGSVEVMGKPVGNVTSRQTIALRRTHIGFVFQRFHLIRGLTALENVCVPLTLDNWDKEKARRRGAELLNSFDLAEKMHVEPKHLSVGQCQRVALARALAADPVLILADEPTASLDAETGQQAMELLRRVTGESGKSVVVVTHDPRILDFADRVLHIENGKVEEAV